MQSTDGEEFWSAGQSLWSLITEHVSESELPKIHAALGHSLVDRYTEAHAEAEMWYTMWRDTHQGVSSRTGTPLPGRHRAPIADPPAVKELVRAEVRMLLQTLTERAGRDGEEILSLYKPETVNYALGHLDTSYSNQADLVNETRSISRLSVQSSAEEEIDAVREKLNIDGIEQVLDRLKSLFMEECEALKKEIKHLQRNIWRKSLQNLDQPEPTLGDLRELRDAVQKDLELYPVSYTSAMGIKSTHRLASVTTHQPRVLSTHSYHTTYTPRPPTGLPPNKTPTSPKQSSISTPSKCITSALIETRKTPGNSTIHLTTSPSRLCSSQIKHNDSNPSPTPANTSSFQVKSQRNSPSDKTHLSSHGTIHNMEGNLSPQMERKHSPSHRSRNTNFVSSPISPCECNKDNKSNDGSISTIQRRKTPNGPQETTATCGNNLPPSAAPSSIRARKIPEMPLSENGATMGKDSNKHSGCEMKLLYAQPKRHLSPKRTLKVNTSQPHNETLERTETEYLSRFIQPVPPPRLK